MAETVLCPRCRHIIAVERDDGLVEIRHHGIKVLAARATIACPHCKNVTLDVTCRQSVNLI